MNTRARQDDIVAALNRRCADWSADRLLRHVLSEPELGRVAVVSSFGAESAVLLHLVARIAADTPVIVVDTGKLFPETRRYREQLTEHLGLRDLRIVGPEQASLIATDRDGELFARDPDRCCALRKTEPLRGALANFDTWISGRKRYQSPTRASLPLLEWEAHGDGTLPVERHAGRGRVKINPLANWRPDDVQRYLREHGLPEHPLVEHSYPSIGCEPCTSPVAAGEGLRAGRWRHWDGKQECGIHIQNGAVARIGS